MTAEHLLDAMGLVDDGLIQEAERYAPSKRRVNYGTWLAWAASFALVLVLGYGVTHPGVTGSGGGNSGGNSQAVPNASAAPNAGGGSEWNGGSTAANDGMPSTEDPMEPAGPAGSVGGTEWEEHLAIMVDGIVYQSTGEIIQLSPDEGDVRYGLEWYDEESGDVRIEPGRCYLMMEDGTVAVSWDVQNHGWLLFTPCPEEEP